MTKQLLRDRLVLAEVEYIGTNTKDFTPGRINEAFFLEFWQGERNNLHVKNNHGDITDFNRLEDFKIIRDVDNVLNHHEAIVKCITHAFSETLFDIKYGKTYKAIGCDKDGMYLVMDESYDCYFYDPIYFEIISDEHKILETESVYYCFGE